MLGISTAISLRPRKAGQPAPAVVGYYTLSSPAFVGGIAIVVKSDTGDVKTLLRTLYVYEYKLAGTYEIEWDGLDDRGNPVAGSDFEAKILTSNLTDNWYTVGNTATLNYGATTFAGYSRVVRTVVTGTRIYMGYSFNEGNNNIGMYVDRAVDIQSANYLNFTPSSNYTNLSTEYVCATPNGDYVFYAGVDVGNGHSWVYGIKTSDGTQLALTSGTSKSAVAGITYPNAIGISTNSANTPSGLACSNDYLWLACEALDEIYAFDISGATPSGALTSNITAFTAPCELAYHELWDSVWMLGDNFGTKGMLLGEVNPVDGDITLGLLTISDFPTDKLTIAIDQTNNVLAVISGGSNQYVQGFNIAPQYPAGSKLLWTLGQTGGYQSTAVVANDRFSFSDYTTGLTKGLETPHLSYDNSNGDLLIGDIGCNRVQIYNIAYPSYTKTYVDTIQQFPAVYGVSLNHTNPLKLYIMGHEFDITTSGTWTYVRNFMAQIDVDHYTQGYSDFGWVSTLSNGRTYATLDDNSTYPPNVSTEIVELTNSGIRYTGVYINESGLFFGNFLDEDFTIWQIYSASYLAGQTPILRKKTITSFDGSNNPVYSGWVTVCTLQPIASDDEIIEAGNAAFNCKFDDNIAIVKNKETTTTAFRHLGAYDMTTGDKLWDILRLTSQPDEGAAGYLGHRGQFPVLHYMEAGNDVQDTFQDVQADGDILLLCFNCEGFKGKQVNYMNFYHKTGIPIRQFGTDRWRSDAIGPYGVRASGNSGAFRFFYYNADTLIVTRRDEGYHGASQLDIITGVSSIAIQTVDIVPPVSVPLEGTNLLEQLTPRSIHANTANIVRSAAESSTFKVQTNIMQPIDPTPDLYVRLVASGTEGTSQYVDCDDFTANPAMKRWKVYGDVTFMDYNGTEPTDESNVMVQVLDDTDKIIAQVGMNLFVSNYKLRLNDTVVLNSSAGTIFNNYLADWKSFEIITNALGCEMTYEGYDKVYVDYFDPTANADAPTTVRVIAVSESSGEGFRAIAVQPLQYVDYTTASAAPTVTEAEAINATTIRLTFDMAVDMTNLGHSFKKNGSNLAISSVASFAPNVWDFTVAAMANGDTLLRSYNSGTGDTLSGDFGGGVELASYTDQSVTNSVPASNLTFVNSDSVAASAPELGLVTPAFNLVTGNHVFIAIRTYSATSVSSLTDTAGNTYTLDAYYSSQFKQSIYSCINCVGNANNVITFGASAFDASLELSYVQYSGTITAFEQQVTGTSSGSNNVTSASFTTVQDYEYALCYVGDYAGGQVWTAPSGYTSREIDTQTISELSDKAYTSIQTGITLTASSATAPNFDKQMLIALYRY